tara:strand:+ start:952 stop:1893 length:942 start_codon:yes stop_codon:yes gene_type:complete
MAKQIINVGTVANDGTGDPIRSAMSKTNENFTELYTSVEDIVVPTSITNLGISDGTVGQVLTTNGSGAFTFTTPEPGFTNAEVDTHLNTSTANTGQVLSWDGTDYDWTSAGAGYTNAQAVAAVTASDLDMTGNKVLFGNVYDAVDDLPSASSYHGMFAHVHATGKGYFAHSGSWVELANASDVVSGSLPSRTSPSGSTASLANNVSGDLDLTGFKAYSLLTVTTDRAAWVRIYVNAATRSADNSRGEGTDPSPDAGVIVEVITTGAETVIVSPGVIGYNLESSPTTSVPCRVTNKSGSTSAVLVTLNVLQLEA